MDETESLQLIHRLRKKWISYHIVAAALPAAGASVLLAFAGNKYWNWSYGWGVFYFLLAWLFFILIQRLGRVNEKAIAQLLDQTYPQLEESTMLLLRPPETLNLLERLQYHKTSMALQALPAPLSIARTLRVPAFLLVVALLVVLVLYKLPVTGNESKPAPQKMVATAAKAETVLPQVAGIRVMISPPVYTGKSRRQQQAFNMVTEQGASVSWQLKTTVAAKQVEFIFNDTMAVALQASGKDHREWNLSRTIDSTGFYQVRIDGKLSALYSIEIIKDQPPVVNIASPAQYTVIEMWEAQTVKIITTLTDDYGIGQATIAATIASGSGEAVKFKEQKIALAGFIPGKMQYQLQQTLSLPGLGMQPGDELYFYIQATDNHQQQTRSGTFIVHLPDTAQLMSLEGMANSLTLKPEYFRSQRQIIIETEQLLKEKDTIPEAAFRQRSNTLGIDQQLLRLRYGKFLGDEATAGENNIDEVGGIADFSSAEKIKDAFTDKHDNAEDASFYDAATKKQLRETLNEMWDAEIKLRTFIPQAALPYEYKALRLLKDLQQKSRAYVAKTNFKTTPLDLKKRLTGDLSKIDQPVLKKDIAAAPDKQLPVRRALAVLESIKVAGPEPGDEAQVLQQANLQLHEQALQQPARYLNAIESLKRIMDRHGKNASVPASDILIAEQGLQQLLQAPVHLPSASTGSPRRSLSKQYFENLQKQHP